MPADDGKEQHDAGQYSPLEVFHVEIHALGTEKMKLNNNNTIGQEGKNTDV